MSDPIDRPFLQPLEPTAQQEGLDAPGFYSATSDFINAGVYNGTFRIGPPQTASNLDVASSLAGSNFAPGWRFVQSSNTAITAAQVQNSAAPAGSNLRFTFGAGAANDEAYIEQLIDITGSAVNNTETYRMTAIASDANLEVTTQVQYLRADGTLSGGAQETSTQPFSPPAAQTTVLIAGGATDAKYARFRIIAKRGSAATTGGKTIDLLEVRRDRPAAQLSLSDVSLPATNSPGRIAQYEGRIMVSGPSGAVVSRGLSFPATTAHETPSVGDYQTTSGEAVNVYGLYSNSLAEKFTYTTSTGGSNLLVGWTLAPLNWNFQNVAASSSVRMGYGTAGGPTRFRAPYPSHLVAVTARVSTAVTAGTIVVDIERNQVTEINDIFTFSTTSALTQTATYNIGQYSYPNFDDFSIVITTPVGFTPTTLDIACTLWLAIPLGAVL